VLIQEPDGRVWIVQPTNEYGERKYTLPGGGVEPGLSNQQNALKEIWEETGLQVEITGFAGDFEDSNNKNNGRLYIGKRIGGAPWDAKIESHIVSNKTGKPSAESEVVSLVTLEKAASLLHRTDDLAQLMVKHPPKVDTPTRGKGSEALKKFFAAIQPRAKAYLKANNNQGDGNLHAVQEMRGFNAKPKVLSKVDMDKLVAAGSHIEMLRGVKPVGSSFSSSYIRADKLAEDFRTGDHFPGFGCFGNGTYADAVKGPGNSSYGYAGHYGPGPKSTGSLVRIALPKTAKIIKQSDLEKMVPQEPSGFSTTSHHNYNDQWLGVQAAIAGYDAIHVEGGSGRHGNYGSIGTGNDFYVILNRGICVVQKEDASTHVIK
jgi:ADP-ribose pyrophosphatase YjhB (NUDIX family)